MFEQVTKKNLGQCTKFYNFLPKKMSLNSQKYGFGIRDPEETFSDPRSRDQKGTGSQIRIRNTACGLKILGPKVRKKTAEAFNKSRAHPAVFHLRPQRCPISQL